MFTFCIKQLYYKLKSKQICSPIAAHCHPRSCGVRELQATLKNQAVIKEASREHYVRRNTPSGRTPLTIIRYAA